MEQMRNGCGEIVHGKQFQVCLVCFAFHESQVQNDWGDPDLLELEHHYITIAPLITSQELVGAELRMKTSGDD